MESEHLYCSVRKGLASTGRATQESRDSPFLTSSLKSERMGTQGFAPFWALYQGMALAVPRIERSLGFSPGGLMKSPGPKAHGSWALAARLKRCPNTKPATEFQLLSRTPLTY